MRRSQGELSVVIETEEDGVRWQGSAQSVSSVNSQGPFDILPHHANFITIVRERPIFIRTANRKQKVSFEQAVLYVRDNKLKIFAVKQAK